MAESLTHPASPQTGEPPAVALAPGLPGSAVQVAPPRRHYGLWAGIAGGVLLLLLLSWWVLGDRSRPAAAVAAAPGARPTEPAEGRRLEQALARQRPRGVYLVVDTLANRLYVRRGDETLREAVCSTGSGLQLDDPATGRSWIFDTPRGVHKIRRKSRDPVWTKPDWAFVEEGRALPDDWRERLDSTALGEYSLDMGDGYLIHGTLYRRLLGEAVTHGCIRLGDDDLEAVYRATPLGAPVYVF